ncbi:hypothetical protein VTO42DRAFT_6321 [Malbranchea cinnamomea]
MYGPPHGQPSYYPQTSTPEWQNPPAASQPWQGPEHVAPTPPPPPLPPPGGSVYNPGMYGAMPSHDPNTPTAAHIGGLDTSRWGVKYNQQLQQQQQQQQQYQHPQGHGPSPVPPPVPPRPASAVDHLQQPTASAGAPPAWTAPSPPPNPQNSAYPPSHPPAYQPPWPSQPYGEHNFEPHPPIPPPPPPIPPAYQSEIQQQQQQHPAPPSGWPAHAPYSDQHQLYNYPAPQPQPHYDSSRPAQGTTAPPPPSSYVTTPQGPTHEHLHSPPPQGPFVPPPTISTSTAPPSVSPIPTPASTLTTSPPSAVVGASALGAGGPSDWEHLTPGSPYIDDTQEFHFKEEHEKPAQHTESVELPSDAHPKPTAGPDPAPPPEEHPHEPAQVTPQERPQTPPEKTEPIPTAVDSVSVSPTTPIAPDKPQSDQPQTPVRRDSLASSTVSPDGIIDGVIEAWSRPVSAPKPLAQDQTQRARTDTVSSVGDPPRAATPASSHVQPTPQQGSPAAVTTKSEISAPPSVVTIVDPYADLDPWYKSSLTRYVTMLRKEMETESEEEKFKIFTTFMAKESKLREILYNIEPVSDTPPPKKKSELGAEKKPLKIDTAKVEPAEPADDGDDDDGITYSPGGRPIFKPLPPRQPSADGGLHRSASNPTPPRQRSSQSAVSSPVVGGSASSSIVRDAPVKPPPRSTSVPPGANLSNPAATEPARPAYTPFRYIEGPQRGSEPLKFERPAYQAYSALRMASAESGRIMSHAPAQPAHPDAPAQARGEHNETFLNLVRAKSVAYKANPLATSATPRPGTADPLKKGIAGAIFDELRGIVPSSLPRPAEDPQIVSMRKEIDRFPDDFGFIQKAIDAWDRGANLREAAIEKQRRARQEESEHHIDSLFNDKEIGYSDINVLENEFKQTEAQKQLNEERKEYDKFVEIVFSRVDERLESEIAALQKQYDLALKHLDAEASGVQTGSPSKSQKFQLSHAMRNTVDVFQKLEMRHRKRVETVLERERRRKKAERRFFVFLGDSVALREMDKEFDHRERRILLEAAQSRDQRANKLMDLFDEASMRGIGENQRLLDDIALKVEQVDEELIKNMAGVAPGAHRVLGSTVEFVKFLGLDSESILQTFGTADRILNDADYEVSVCEARVAKSSADIFRRLEEEKRKEDKKIDDDLESRIASLKQGSQEILADIQRVLDLMAQAGIQPSDGGTADPSWSFSPPPAPAPQPASPSSSLPEPVFPPPAPPPSVPPMPPGASSGNAEQQERLRKALEDAKRRNAAKFHGGAIP